MVYANTPKTTESLLTEILNMAYQDQIDRVLLWEFDGVALTGEFVDGDRVFTFGISVQDGLVYRPIQAKADSLYPQLKGKTEAYVASFLQARRDATRSRGKKRNCTSPTSYSCGASCINNEKVCQIAASDINPAYIQKLVDFAAREGGQSQPTQQAPGAFGKQGAIAEGASIAQMQMPVYSQVRANYRKNFPQSAEKAKLQSQTIEVEDIGDKTHVTFAIGGLTGEGMGGSERLAGELSQIGLNNHHIVPISNEDFDIPAGIKASRSPIRFSSESLKLMFTTTLKEGSNPAAIRTAAYAKAYKDKYPKAKISLVGHSGGGIVGHEASEVLESHMGIDVQNVAMGSPWFGITEPTQKSLTFASEKDPIVAPGNVMNGNWVNSVPGHSQADYLRNEEVRSQLRAFLGGTELPSQKKRGDAQQLRRKIPLNMMRQLITALVPVLEGSYTDGVDQVIDVNPQLNGDISGIFRDGSKILEFDLKGNRLSYKMAMRSRSDAWLSGYATEIAKLELETSYRLDAPRRSNQRKNCKTGISCGYACISRNKTCQVELNKIASPSSILRLKQASITVAKQNQAKASDNLDKMTIRELKDEARKRQVYRYSEMNSEQLKDSIRFVDQNPDAQQERIARTVKRRKQNTQTLNRMGVNPQGKDTPVPGSKRKVNPERDLVNAVQKWNRIQKILKLSDVDPSLATLAVGAIFTGVTLQTYNKLRDDYRLRIPDNAKDAQERARKIKVDYTPRTNITFAVGGYQAEGSGGQKLKDLLEGEGDKENATDMDKWWKQKNKIIPIETNQFQIDAIKSPKYLKDGKTYNPTYLAELSSKSFGRYLRNFRRKKNDDAVQLAADIYAHANYRTKTRAKKEAELRRLAEQLKEYGQNERQLKSREKSVNRKFKDPDEREAELQSIRESRDEIENLIRQVKGELQDKRQSLKKHNAFANDPARRNINIVAHATGGNTVYEALEILARMDEPGLRSGREILKRLNVVTIGTTDFGFTDKNLARERNITSAQDPFSILPQRNEKWVSQVRGHEIEDYLKSDEVLDQLRQAFGYYDQTIAEIERRGG